MSTFKNYWQSLTPGQKRLLAASADTDANYLSQIAGGHRMAGARLIASLCNANSDITPEMLRPDLYGRKETCSAA